jgi:hypothetical protein
LFVIQNTFIAKPGCAGKLAAQLKAGTAAFKMSNVRVMTDVTGGFNTVVMEYTAESLAELETRMQALMGSPEYKEKMAGYTELWTSGSRQILRVV